MSDRHSIVAFPTIGGCLAIGGISIDRLAARVGSTPFFAYDRRLLTSRVGLLRSALPRKIELSYAIKANPMPAVVQHLAGLVDGFDVASAMEMRTALDTTVPASRVSFAGPGKTTDELEQAIAATVTIELESTAEAARVAQCGTRLGIRPRVAIRVNPPFQVKGSGMRMGGGSQQFGIDEGIELEMAQLQQPDRLHQLRRQCQRLRLPNLEPRRQRHMSRPLSSPAPRGGAAPTHHGAFAREGQEACQGRLRR